ncbi:MAG: hypothetical protein CSA96_08515 [Bacteroidetes bacterium]|nr:MAG: hypothetical protein CSA96_08515 [Bacteroidota bacterium]
MADKAKTKKEKGKKPKLKAKAGDSKAVKGKKKALKLLKGKKKGKAKEKDSKASKGKGKKTGKLKREEPVSVATPAVEPLLEQDAAALPAVEPLVLPSDSSSDYNVKEALRRMRAIEEKEALLAFVKGEKRVTVTRAIPAAMNRLA